MCIYIYIYILIFIYLRPAAANRIIPPSELSSEAYKRGRIKQQQIHL